MGDRPRARADGHLSRGVASGAVSREPARLRLRRARARGVSLKAGIRSLTPTHAHTRS
ncbi:hypothetical protein BURKHO8Y_170134 [Burkholderia sp. 8Y]|nr:hypothetical protein BURKHO8Y_170134 [Burkholderia sp. 8Y]